MAQHHPHPHELDELRDSLVDLTEALFDRAPFLRRGFVRSGSRLLTITRGPGHCDAILQKLEHSWHFFVTDTQHSLSDEWQGGLARFKREIQEPCRHCANNDAYNPFHPTGECPVCTARVVAIAEAMEAFAKSFNDRIRVEQPSTQAATVQTAASEFTTYTPSQIETEQAGKIEVLERKVTEMEVRVAEKEAELNSHKETMDEMQKAMDNILSDSTAINLEKQDFEKAKNDIMGDKDALETELNAAVDNIAIFASDLLDGNRFHTAQSAYGVLHQATLSRRARIEDKPENQDARRELELKALGYKHKQVSALLTLGQTREAEPMAREVWLRCKDLLAESDAFTRNISRDYCKILRRNGKHAEAEREYMLMMWSTDDSNPEVQEWRLDTESLIAEVYAEQRKHGEAFHWHRRILRQRLERVPCEIEKAALSAVQCFAALAQEQALGRDLHDSSMLADIERIWNEKPAHRVSEPILACGHDLGVRMSKAGRADEAVPVMLDVWERRKALGNSERHKAASMETAFALVEISVRSENLPRLETLYHWILQNPTPNQAESDKLWFRYRLGCVQAVLQKWAVAEDNLRKALTRQAELFGADDPDTIQYTIVLAEVLRRDKRTAEAADLVSAIWERRTRLEQHLEAVMRAGHLYGETLADSPDEADWPRAESVLSHVWGQISALLAHNPTLVGVLSVGDCYSICMMKQGRFSDAKEALQRVVWWRFSTRCEEEDIGTSTHVLQRATEFAARTRKPKYRPVGISHPLRLKYLLSPWLRAGATPRTLEGGPGV